MYESKKKNINWMDLGIKVALLAIGLFIVYLLIPKYDLNPFYDRIFNENVGIMERAAMAYYTIDRMPEEDGESHRMTLQEMLNAKMILPFVDKDGKFCDGENSFVEITKNAHQLFSLKIQLSCGTRIDYIIRTIGCYDVCRIVEMEFEFRRQKQGFRWVCPKGYTLRGNKCYKTGTDRTPAEPIRGGDRVEITDALLREGETITQTTPPTSSTGPGRHHCPNGTLSGSNCIIGSSSTVPAEWIPGTTTRSCPSGWNLSGTTCHRSVAATPNNSTQTQDAGISAWRFVTSYRRTSPMTTYTRTLERLVANGTTSEFTCGNPINCPVRQTFWHYRYYQRNYTCPSGFSLSGSTCSRTTTTHSCPSGLSLSGTTCSGTQAASASTTPGRHNCPNGTLSGSNCLIGSTSTVPAQWIPGTTTWSCPSGFTHTSGSGANMICSRSVTGTGRYYCPDATAVLFNTNKCAKTIRGSITGYRCPNKNDVLKGEWCYRTKTTDVKDATKTPTTSWERKWHKGRTLEGWEATGKSRPIGQPDCNKSK